MAAISEVILMNQSVNFFLTGIPGLICLFVFSISDAETTVSDNVTNGAVSTNFMVMDYRIKK